MRPWVLACLLGACSFENTSSGVADAAEADGAVGDAPPDTPALLPPCDIGPMATPGTDRGRVGGDFGGDNFPPIACRGNDVIVGIAVRMSDGNTLYNTRSAHGLTIACAPVSIDRNTGIGTTGTVTTVEVMGSGAEGWSPSTQSAVAQCPPGHVVNGLQTRTGSSNNVFKEVRFRCAKLDGSAVTVQPNPVIYVQGSLTEPNGIDTVNCNTNEIVTQLGNRTGSGFDSANVFCSPARCL